ncbi:siderophore-interacting protein [Actinopolyspora erythraea]|uniref:siderophore-interacting protein n=1 Tax=Actinopolyspora erythraea TaxID=414996 RepID=UPI000B21A152|nr:siderophore-interacting protein [Actinopolyspora erythraea]
MTAIHSTPDRAPVRARYRQLEVRAVERLTPRMVRVVLGGDELADFVSSGTDQRVKLCLPRPGMPVPLGGSRGEVFAGPPERQPRQRTYTVRWFAPERRELAVDLVRHEHDAPGSRWIAEVAVGDRVVTVGPSPAYRPDPAADPLVLVGDETALPAITAILEEVPSTTPVRVLAEVADEAECAYAPRFDGVRWSWLCRDGLAPGESELLPEALRTIELGADPHVWIGAEAGVVRRARELCETELGLGRSRLHALAYWRRDGGQRVSG